MKPLLDIDFTGGLKIDRLHRSLARRKPDGQPPRAVLARFVRFQVRERIAEAARKMGKHADGHRIHEGDSAELQDHTVSFHGILT
ncbi:hypothetical protein AAFF_G00207890 [Aldrovandia affinis]|uniref:Uncharacterized protein n=1 Tax=Aldrovandia affinis TaxID=143900 RepID=A0AAD7RJZ0_9TELE|nr:hypothetical protein AAFF_G00207890 [Aldrovandia affinis]